MLLLLPPSEGKSAPADGPPLDLADLSHPELREDRDAVLDALVAVSGRPDALEVLGAGPSLAGEVAANTALRDAATAPARTVYTGVLYAAAGLATLDENAAARAHRSVRTVSALWGLVAPEDRVPAYRLSMGTTLPGPGRLAAFWRPALRRVLDERAAHELVVDCRSSAYAAAWRDPGRGPGVVPVRVLTEQGTRRTVVSHWAKHTRGVLVRHLLTRGGQQPGSPDELLAAARELVGTDLLDAGLDGGTLELVVS